MAMKYCLRLIGILVLFGCSQAAYSQAVDLDTCPDGNILEGTFDRVCWDCFLDNFNLFGVGNKPDGAAPARPVCACYDDIGVPTMGYPLGMWTPTKINEVVTQPFCSPSLGGTRLQNTARGTGYAASTEDAQNTAFYQYHYFSYPLMTMMELLMLPQCMDPYYDFDLLYISEIDPTWSNDILSILLSPEAVIFANPVAKAWCAADCVATTANQQQEAAYGCAGCDGSLYPFTGHINPQPDPVAGSSLITQRVLASLHRKGLAQKTIGEDAMCGPSYYPMVPRSQYKFSLMYPIAEASTDVPAEITSNPSSGWAGQSGDTAQGFNECCHPMGMSTSRWCTPVGGRIRPGKDKAFVYMIWNYRDCCVTNDRSADEG